MQNVRSFCFLYLLFLCLPLSLFAQEAFNLNQIYFQDEIIRKVSVGDGGIWVIKGADSTGVGKLEADGRQLDYSQTVNSTVPLTGIVGKYGDSAMIATRGNYLLMYDKGNISTLDDESGIYGNVINDLQGTPNYTRAATDWGARESYDNRQFSAVKTNAYVRSGAKILRVSRGEDYSAMASITRDSQCFSLGEDVFNIIIKTPATLYQTYFQLNGEKDLNALTTNHDGRSYYLTLFLGNRSGLRVRNWECRSRETHLLQDTTVYAVSKLEDLMLIGTEKGLFTCPPRYPKQAVKINLNEDYEVYDIAIQEEEGLIWLGTNKGLVKLQKESLAAPNARDIDALEWVRNIGSQFPDNSFSTLSDKQGNVFITGYFQGAVNFGDSTIIAQNQKDFFIAKYNAQGKLIWVRSVANSGSGGKSMDEEGEYLALDDHENVYVTLRLYSTFSETESWEVGFGAGVKIETGSGSGKYIVKYDKNGTALWVNPISYYTPYDGFQMETDSKGNLYLSMQLSFNNPYNLPEGRGILKFSPDFELLWAKQFSERLDFFKLKKNGEFYLSGRTNGTLTIGELEIEPDVRQELVIVYFDQNGTPKWWKNFGGYSNNAHIRYIRDIGYDLQGNTFIAGEFAETLDFGDGEIQQGPDGLYGVFVAKINAIGNFEWVHIGSAHSPYVKGLEVDSLGAAYLSLNYRETMMIGDRTYQAGEENLEAFVAKFDYAGGLSWAYSVPGLKLESKGIARDHKNNLYLNGTLTEDLRLNGELLKAGGGTNIFLAKITDTTSPLNRNLVRGKAYFDKNKNNIFDEGDVPLPDNIIKAEPGPVYAKSDLEGDYYLYLDKGNFSINQIIPEHKGKRITQTSPDAAYQLSLSGTKADTAGFDFAHDVQLSPYLSVDVSSTRFRRCFTNNTVVEYCNEGFAAAEDVQLVLEYPEYVIPQSSNVPWTAREGQKLIFDLGTLQARQCKSIILTDSVMCGDESIRGQVQCIKAYISPDNSTEINPHWDQSDIELSAECKDNGFVRLNIRNTGSGNMADSAVFRIFLSETLSYTGKYKLQKEESISLNVLANGKALHLEAELTPFHPQKRTASISIDGCDDKGNPQLQHHFTNQFPQHDDKENYEISCLEIIDSYDPNDKQVIPAGISAERYVAEGSLLEYTIRFQNTGTDTAYTVVITDLLDKNMDIASLEMGLSSHPVKWELSGEGNIHISWRFDRINLPDSTTNEKASHGFVKFKISPKEEAGFGTTIRNQAAIYFDYNSPIITNETLTTLGIPETPPPGGLLLQNCDVAVSLQQEEDVEVILCETDSLMLTRLAPAPGGGIWSIVKGEGNIKDKNSHNTLVNGIAYGENIFQWEVTYCDVLLRSTVTVIRKKLPAAPLINPVPNVCQDDPLPLMTAKGEQVEWYADPALTQLLGTGKTYQPKVSESTIFYVIQQNEHCRSQPAMAELNILPKPAPPVAASVEICAELNNAVTLSAEGNNIRWYADGKLNTLIGEGEEYQLADRQGREYYVTQSSDYCESDPTKVVVSSKVFDPARGFIANVITPNGDEWNQSFYVKEFDREECLGDFVAVKIYNRLGSLVYESSSRDFRWDAGKVNPGIYFYSLEFAVRKFNGSVQVLQ